MTALHGSGTGGLVGASDEGFIEASFATGDVRSEGAAGGLVGGVSSGTGTSAIRDSYARGAVTASGDSARVGGLLGEARTDPTEPGTWWTVSSSYATGQVSGPSTIPTLVQGLVGGGDVHLKVPSFWDSTVNPGLPPGAGEPRTTAQLRTKATYGDAGWDIQTGGTRGADEAVWGICVPADTAVHDGYAFLLWQHDANPCPAVPKAPVLTTVTGGDTTLAVVAALGSSSNPPVTAVQYSLDGGPWRASGGAAGSFTIRGLTNGRTYAVRVRAVNGLGAGAASNQKSGTPHAQPVPPAAKTRLDVAARARIPLPLGRPVVLVRSVRTNGEVRSVRAPCWWRGQKLSRALSERLCGVTVTGPSGARSASDGAVPAGGRVKVRVAARPQCSGLTVVTTVVAKKAGAARALFSRQWKVRASPAVACRVAGTG